MTNKEWKKIKDTHLSDKAIQKRSHEFAKSMSISDNEYSLIQDAFHSGAGWYKNQYQMIQLKTNELNPTKNQK